MVAKETKLQICKTCLYSRKVSDPDIHDEYECRKRAPTVREGWSYAVWPIVHPYDWCDEYYDVNLANG